MKNQTNWTDEQRADAFVVWAGDAGKNFRKARDMTGIPLSTLYYWASADHWEERYKDHVMQLGQDAMEVGRVELRLGISAAVRRLISHIEDDSLLPSEHRASIRDLFTMLMEMEARPNTPSSLLSTATHPISLPSPRDRATAAIEANINEANAESQRGRRRTF